MPVRYVCSEPILFLIKVTELVELVRFDNLLPPPRHVVVAAPPPLLQNKETWPP